MHYQLGSYLIGFTFIQLTTYSTLVGRQQSLIQFLQRSKPGVYLLLILDGTKNRVGLWPFFRPSRSAPRASYPTVLVRIALPTAQSQVLTVQFTARRYSVCSCVASRTLTILQRTQVYNIVIIRLFSESATIYNVKYDSEHPGSSFLQMWLWILKRKKNKHSTPVSYPLAVFNVIIILHSYRLFYVRRLLDGCCKCFS